MKNRILYLVFAIFILIIWQFSSDANNTVRFLISSPLRIIDYFIDNTSTLLLATGITFIEAFLGLVLATSFSFITMILCVYKPKLLSFLMPIMIGSQVVPVIVLAPFFILLLGIGISSKIAMAALMSFFPIFVNLGTGIKSVPTEILDFAYINKASTWKKIKHIFFPMALPNIFTGLKIAATFSVIGAIVAEFTGAKIGLGKNLFISAIRLEPELMMTSLLLSTILGLSLFGTVRIIEKMLIK